MVIEHFLQIFETVVRLCGKKIIIAHSIYWKLILCFKKGKHYYCILKQETP